MIISIGIDILEKNRIKKNIKLYKKKIQNKIFSTEEKKIYKQKNKKIEFISKIFTLKESIAKALGTGFRNNINIKNIKILQTELKKPYINLKKKTYVSLSHEQNITLALVIILKI